MLSLTHNTHLVVTWLIETLDICAHKRALV